ncbi:hypothetical protein ACFSTD_12465 [Novosphingobium colocasiae]
MATLTAPLRRMFTRMGGAAACAGTGDCCAGQRSGGVGGRYYDADPMVCAGLIAEGQRAIAGHLAARRRAAA